MTGGIVPLVEIVNKTDAWFGDDVDGEVDEESGLHRDGDQVPVIDRTEETGFDARQVVRCTV